MQLPVKVHYATLAMLALAEKHENGELLPARVIACQHKIPSQFLGQIMQQLRSSGLIQSTRGANGGFQLVRAPSETTVADIFEAVCSFGSERNGIEENGSLASVVLEVWDQLSQIQKSTLEKISLTDLLERSQESASPTMFYI